MGNAIDTTMATMTPKSTYTAKGSIAAATGASTPANLSVGNNGETLVADSSTSTGLRYQVPVNVNPVLNSAFQIAQRGTSVTCSGNATTYTLDRWAYLGQVGSAVTVSRQATSDTTNLPSIQYCARYSRTAGNTTTGVHYFANVFETVNSIPYAGKTVTLSYYARAGANYSPTSNGITMTLAYGTGTDQALGGGAAANTAFTANATLTTTWQRFTLTGSVPTTATQLVTMLTLAPTGTAGANDYFEVTGVQLEVGSVATPFKTNGATIQGELAACQRYYYKWVDGLGFSGVGASMGLGANYNATQMNLTCAFPVTMRTNPTLVATTGSAYYKFERNGAQDDFNSLTIFHSGVSQAMLYNATEISGTAGQAGSVSTQSASASVAFSAEL
jgi:hypothetical protein